MNFLSAQWQALLKYAILAGGVLLLLAGVRKSGKDAEKTANLRGENESLRRALHQDAVVRDGASDGWMQTQRLSEALRGKRDPDAP